VNDGMLAVHPSASAVRPRPPVDVRPGCRCLVVSDDPGLRRRIMAAAAACGWTCSDPGDAASLAAIGRGFQIVFIDLVRPPPGVAAADIAAAFAADRGTRVVACGASDRPDEEILARESGVSVYVPGVAPGPGLSTLVRALCR